MNRARETLWPLAKRYWFHALVIVGLGISMAVAVADLHHKNGPEGPLWFDVAASIAYLLPFFFRRRYPFGAPVAVFVLITAISFVDAGLVNAEGVMFIAAIVSAFLFGMLKDRRKSVAGIGIMIGAWNQ